MNKLEWRISDGAVSYAEALAVMEERVADIRAGRERELVWLLEHPPLYTAGTSARPQDLLQPMRFPVHVAGRGGQYTYHGPGQRVVYAMLDLRRRRQDVRRFVSDLEEWTILSISPWRRHSTKCSVSVRLRLLPSHKCPPHRHDGEVPAWRAEGS